MSEYTKGKLKIMPYTRRDGDNIRWIKDERNKAICQTFKPRAEANANRLALCWNNHDKLTAHRDDLLTALGEIKGIVGNADHGKGHGVNSARLRGDMLNVILGIAKAAIAGG